ncbi:Sybindin-like protein [Kalmanozyma brasiliensis GHG001]|uniref:Trafficking protein particle complex subunit n=1 Tax=Kalmanozyma brasiliensis (strain GHG001) TaxID=1365824 RepID=V5EXY5_KALBG|nr:Sybindin-like protein [Kalmanozyma brasiliensis GHG001]EST08483.1 Sybindin-like protein [Kalmanozyma brasiliensis GHG001]
MAKAYSFWVFDRHCNAIYHQDWSHIHAAAYTSANGPLSPSATSTSGFASIGASIQRATSGAANGPANETPLAPQRPGQPSLPNVTRLSSSSAAAQNGASTRPAGQATIDTTPSDLLPFDEEAKLVYGVVFSLRNMVRKLGGEAETFNSFTTSTYTLSHLHTPSMYTFVLVTDPVAPPSSIPNRASEGYSIGNASAALSGRAAFGTGGGIPGTGGMSLKGVLLQIYRGPWVDCVVRNPLLRALEREERVVQPNEDAEKTTFDVVRDGRLERSHGIDTDAFRESLEKVLSQNKLSAPVS